MMNPVIRKQWAAALRSGNYDANNGMRLRDLDTTKFCAVGVLCDVVASTEWKISAYAHPAPDGSPRLHYYIGEGETSVPPLVAERSGLNPFGSTAGIAIAMSLACAPFSSIADFIETAGGDWPATMYSRKELQRALDILDGKDVD